jgi:hypothetical protein
MHVRLDRQGLGVALGGGGPQAAGFGEVGGATAGASVASALPQL